MNRIRLTFAPVLGEAGFTPNELTETYYRLTSDEQRELMYETETVDVLDAGYNPGTEITDDMILDAVSSTYGSRFPRSLAALQRAFNRQLPDGIKSHDEPVIGRPRRAGGFATVTAQFPFGDGQTVSIVFHAPGADGRVSNGDELIAFRWLLNKRDITVAVAPEMAQGVMRDIPLQTVARRVTQLLEKNSERFIARQSQAAEQKADLTKAEDLVKELDDRALILTDEIGDLETQSGKSTGKVTKLTDQLDDWNQRNGDLLGQIDSAKTRAESQKDPIEALTTEQRQTVDTWRAFGGNFASRKIEGKYGDPDSWQLDLTTPSGSNTVVSDVNEGVEIIRDYIDSDPEIKSAALHDALVGFRKGGRKPNGWEIIFDENDKKDSSIGVLTNISALDGEGGSELGDGSTYEFAIFNHYDPVKGFQFTVKHSEGSDLDDVDGSVDSFREAVAVMRRYAELKGSAEPEPEQKPEPEPEPEPEQPKPKRKRGEEDQELFPDMQQLKDWLIAGDWETDDSRENKGRIYASMFETVGEKKFNVMTVVIRYVRSEGDFTVDAQIPGESEKSDYLETVEEVQEYISEMLPEKSHEKGIALARIGQGLIAQGWEIKDPYDDYLQIVEDGVYTKVVKESGNGFMVDGLRRKFEVFDTEEEVLTFFSGLKAKPEQEVPLKPGKGLEFNGKTVNISQISHDESEITYTSPNDPLDISNGAFGRVTSFEKFEEQFGIKIKRRPKLEDDGSIEFLKARIDQLSEDIENDQGTSGIGRENTMRERSQLQKRLAEAQGVNDVEITDELVDLYRNHNYNEGVIQWAKDNGYEGNFGYHLYSRVEEESMRRSKAEHDARPDVKLAKRVNAYLIENTNAKPGQGSALSVLYTVGVGHVSTEAPVINAGGDKFTLKATYYSDDSMDTTFDYKDAVFEKEYPIVSGLILDSAQSVLSQIGSDLTAFVGKFKTIVDTGGLPEHNEKNDQISGLAAKDIKTLIHNEFKADIKAGKLPKGLKIRATSDNKGGKSVNFVVTLPESIPLFNQDFLREDEGDRYRSGIPTYHNETRALLKRMKAVAMQYNDNNGDHYGDYGARPDFYLNLNIDADQYSDRMKSESPKTLTAEEIEADKNLNYYGLQLRPGGFANTPGNFEKIITPGEIENDPTVSKLVEGHHSSSFRHGVIAYSRKLEDSEVSGYQLYDFCDTPRLIRRGFFLTSQATASL